MLDLTATNIWQEIQAGERLRDSQLANLARMVQRFHGVYFNDDDTREAENVPANTYFEYISLMKPQVVFNNPRVRLKSRRRQGAEAEIALGLQHATNRWIRETKMRKLLDKVCTDMFFAYGVTLTTQIPRPGIEKQNERMPQVTRIPPEHYICDPLAFSRDDLRFQAHKWVRDHEDLIEEAREDPKTWNLKAVEGLSEGDSGVNKNIGNTRSSLRDRPERNEVWCYTLWIPEYELEKSEWKRLGISSKPEEKDGFWGALFDIAVNQAYSSDPEKAAFIRPPRPFFGHWDGPYTMYGDHYVPGSVYPLSSLLAVEGLTESLNEVERGISGSMTRYKRFIVCDSESSAQKYKDVPHDNILIIPGFEKGTAEQYELGGVTDQMLAGKAIYREQLDRTLGMNDAMRGNVTGAGTATENVIAENAGATRAGHLKQAFSDATSENLEKVAYLMYADERYMEMLPPEAAMELEEPSGLVEFQGGGGSVEGFRNLELDLEPYAMERTSEALQQRRAQLGMQLVTTMVPVMAQFPNAADYEGIINDLGDSVNSPDLGARFFPEKAAGDLDALNQQQGASPVPGGGGLPAGGGLRLLAPPGSQMSGREGQDTEIEGAAARVAGRPSG